MKESVEEEAKVQDSDEAVAQNAKKAQDADHEENAEEEAKMQYAQNALFD